MLPVATGSIFYIILVTATATTTATTAVAKEEQYEAYSDDNPNIFTVKKVAQAVHS